MELQRSAQIMGNELKAIGVKVRHTVLLEMVAKATGHENYAAAKAELELEEQTFSIPINLEAWESNREMEVTAKTAKEALYKVKGWCHLTFEVDRSEDFDLNQRDMEVDVEISLECVDGITGYHVKDEEGNVHVVTEEEMEAEENAGNV